MIKVGGKTYLASPDETVPLIEGEVLIKLKPIFPLSAFGYGWHITTKRFVELVESLDLAGKKVLDLGCGNGILSILAKKLGASEVIGIDREKHAVDIAKQHAELNAVDCAFYETDMDTFDQRNFDVVLCNIDFKPQEEVEKFANTSRFAKPTGHIYSSFSVSDDWRLEKSNRKKPENQRVNFEDLGQYSDEYKLYKIGGKQ